MNVKTNFLKIKLIIIFLSFIIVILAAALSYFTIGFGKKTPQTTQKQPTPISQASFTFLAFGDSGTGSSEQKALAKLMEDQNPDIVIHTGDLAYPDGSYEAIQKNVIDIYKDLFAKSKFYPSLGNHDYQTDKGKPFVETFTLPGNERYYSFRFENTLFVALDTNNPLNDSGREMLRWFEETLANRSKEVVWTVVYFHHPPYSSGATHGNDLRVQQKLVPALEKYKVDIVFSGHEHNYQRTCEILNNMCVDDGVLYIVTGGGGASLYKVGEPAWFTQAQSSVYHFVKGKIDGCKLTLEAIDISGSVFDRVSLSKC